MILRLDNFLLLEFAISFITVDIREKMMIDHRRFWYKAFQNKTKHFK